MSDITLKSVNISAGKNLKKQQTKNVMLENKGQVKDGDKKLKVALYALAVVSVAAMTGVVLKKKMPTVKLVDIDFSKGIPSNKDGSKFTGVIKDKLKNGDKIKMVYQEGILTKSTRTGSKNFIKKFEMQGGNKIVTTVTNKGTKTSNITKLAQDGKLKKEAIEEAAKRINSERTAQIYQTQAQANYNRPFIEDLSNKSAKDSASVFQKQFEDEIKQEAILRNKATEKAEQIQSNYTDQFTKNLSKKEPAELAEAMLTKKTKHSIVKPTFDENGNIIKRTAKSRVYITNEFFDAKGNVTTRITLSPSISPSITKTTYDGYFKTVKTSLFGKITKAKYYVKENGKYKQISRENYYDSGYKKVEYLKDGISKTTEVDDLVGTAKITFRDKKGNIIDIQEYYKKLKSLKPQSSGPLDKVAEKNYEPWYIDYSKLCKEFGFSMRPCGVEGGAWSHYRELLKMKEGGKVWDDYIREENYRARYDVKSKIMQLLRDDDKGINNTFAGFSEANESVLVQLDDKTLLELLKTAENSGTTFESLLNKIRYMLYANNGKENISVVDIAKQSMRNLHQKVESIHSPIHRSQKVQEKVKPKIFV